MSRYLAFIEKNLDVRNQTGDEILVLCIFHQESNPSMNINIRKGVFLCRSCGAKGNMDALAKALNTTVMDNGIPVSALRSRIELRTGREGVEIGKPLPESFLDRYSVPHDYWTDTRGFSPEAIEMFDLGYDIETGRLTIPIRDSKSRLLGIIYRQLDRTPKYLYPKGFAIGKSLFGSWLIRENNRKRVALVEGPLDAVACWDAKVPALALLGARLSNDQRRLLRSLGVNSVVVMTDKDNAGRDAVKQIAEELKGQGIAVKVGEYRSYWLVKDPGELSVEQRRRMFWTAIPVREYLKSFGR